MKKKKEFEEYLKGRSCSDNDVYNHILNVGYFCNWASDNQIKDIRYVRPTDVLDYVKYIQSIPVKTGTIRCRLNSIRKYFNRMIELGYISKNPASDINIGRKEKKVLANPLSAMTLNTIYQDFEMLLDSKPTPNNREEQVFKLAMQRYKLIVSLIIFQALDMGELDRLRVEDVNASKGTIYIASKARRSSRVLKLEASQILPFYQYIQMLPPRQDKLFAISVEKSLYHILNMVKGIDPRVVNAEHIRQSRIMIWVSTLDLLEAKYRIGHKFVSSTKHYADQNITGLIEEVGLVHLFK